MFKMYDAACSWMTGSTALTRTSCGQLQAWVASISGMDAAVMRRHQRCPLGLGRVSGLPGPDMTLLTGGCRAGGAPPGGWAGVSELGQVV